MAKKAFSADNQFSFKCPVFNVDTPIKSCIELREIVWSGQRPAVRKGCQCCLRSGKCPINDIIRDVDRSDDENMYYSAKPVVGKLMERHVKRTERIVTTQTHMQAFDLSQSEVSAILAANPKGYEVDRSKVKYVRHPQHAQREVGWVYNGPSDEELRIKTPTRAINKPTKFVAKTVDSKDYSAATSGDMAAAIKVANDDK